ncbi:uncharacterized protein LOC125296826, partial [Xyrichtys novacula]
LNNVSLIGCSNWVGSVAAVAGVSEASDSTAPRVPSCSSRVLADAVLQVQRDTITSINEVAKELQEIKCVLTDIAATLRQQVENAVRQGKTGLACTDRQNKWNAGSQRNAGQRKMKDVQFKRHYRQKIYQPSTTMQSSTTTSSTTTNSRQEARLFGTHEEWRKHVLASPMAGLFTCLLQLCLDADPSPTTPQSPPLHNLSHDDHHTPLSCRKCRTFYDDYVNMPTAQLENIEKLTKAQSKVQGPSQLQSSRA